MSEEQDVPDDVRVEALEHRIAGMIREAVVALGINPTGWAWRCDGCGESVTPDRSFGHTRGVDEHCGPVGIANEFQAEAWAAVLEAIRAKRAAVEAIGYCVLSRDNEPVSLSVFKETADDHCARLNIRAALGTPFRVVPVGPVTEAESPKMTLTTGEMFAALGFAAPDGYVPGDDDLDTTVTFQRLPKRESVEGGTLPAGLWCWLTEYPDEGCFPLFDIDTASAPDRPAEAAVSAPAGTDLATHEGVAGDWSVAPGGVEGGTGQSLEDESK